MLTRELMGLFALGVLWLNTGLVLAVALRQLGNVLSLRRRVAGALARGELVTGTARAEGDRFALRCITQHGRAVTTKGPDRIVFTDGPQSFEVLGGHLTTDSGAELEVPACQPGHSEVWIDARRSGEGIACRGSAEFERAWSEASTFKGHARTIELAVRGGDRVWVLGARRGDRLEPPEGAPLLVSMVDPIAFCGSRVRLLAGFLGGATLVLAGVTLLALWPPVFGLASTLGGAAGLAYFLAIQPIGTAVRDAVKTPSRRLVGALWRRPEGQGARDAGTPTT